MSGIYIPGVEMPKRNFLDLRIQPNGVVYEFEGGYHLYYKTDKAMNVPDYGRLIDADEFLKRAIGTKCFRGDYALMLEELVGESTTIIESGE